MHWGLAYHQAGWAKEGTSDRGYLVQDYLDKLASVQAKGDDYEIAAAQIGVEVYSAMSSAVGAS